MPDPVLNSKPGLIGDYRRFQRPAANAPQGGTRVAAPQYGAIGDAWTSARAQAAPPAVAYVAGRRPRRAWWRASSTGS
jgi:hypothetical protein